MCPPQQHIPKAKAAADVDHPGTLISRLLMLPEPASTRPKAPGFVPQREGAGEEQGVSASQSLIRPLVQIFAKPLRRQASDDAQDAALELHSKAAPGARPDMAPIDDDALGGRLGAR